MYMYIYMCVCVCVHTYIHIYLYIYAGTAAETDDLVVTLLDASGKLLVWQLFELPLYDILKDIYIYIYIYIYIHLSL